MIRHTARASLALVLSAGLALPQTPGARSAARGSAAPLRTDNSARVHELIRAGNLYLSLADALALAIENNLDIELQRNLLPAGDTELLRTRGGGVTRGLNFTLLEAPTGTGGPLSPVLTSAAAAGRATAGSSVSTSAIGLNILGEPQVNASILGTTAQSNGSAIPNYDPAVTGQLNWTHQTTPQSS
jgi:outer membrane protein